MKKLTASLLVAIVSIHTSTLYAVTYQIDDGSWELALGPSLGGTQAWMNSFQIQTGGETLTSIDLVQGSGTASGPAQPFTVYLWTDPTNDGNPIDALAVRSAVLLSQNTNAFINVSFAPLTLPAGSWIFAGGIYSRPFSQLITASPAREDRTAPTLLNRSYLVNWEPGVIANPNNLSANGFFGARDGNFLVRVNATSVPEAGPSLIIVGALLGLLFLRSPKPVHN